MTTATLHATQLCADDELRVTGTLVSDASMLYSAGETKTAFLVVEIRPAQGLPYIAKQNLGTDPKDHYAAAAKAATFKRGCRVQVYARGLRAQTDHGHARLALLGVTGVFLINHRADETASHTGG